MDNADLIILPLHSYRDYKHLYRIIKFPGPILGVRAQKHSVRGGCIIVGTIMVSCRESIGNVQQLLHALSHTKLYRHDGQTRP